MSLKDLYKQERRDKTVNALKDIDKLGKKSSDSFKEQSSILGIITGQYNNLIVYRIGSDWNSTRCCYRFR